MTRTYLTLAALLLAGCVSTPGTPPADHRFVVVGPDGGAVARVITAAALIMVTVFASFVTGTASLVDGGLSITRT